jgi:hypothetical protein
MVKKIQKEVQKKTLMGGDGYSLSPSRPIGGLLGFSRYSNNNFPVFEGELLQNGGNGYTVNVSKEVGQQPIITRYTDTEMSQGCSIKQNGGGDCGCSGPSKDPSIFNLIKLNGGEIKKISQFSAIKSVSYFLTPLSLNSLVLLTVKLFLNILEELKPRKSKQLGGYVSELQNIIAPLGKNNLLVLSSLLLLHYFAVETQKNKINKTNKINVLKGGDPFINTLTNILLPTGLNTMGSSILLVMLQQAFVSKKVKNIQSGGNPLKNLIAPLGTNAFIATGLLIILEKMFVSRMNQVKKNNNTELIGGKINKKYEELFNLLAPITFNTFAKKSFLENYAKNNLKETSNKKK